jgi:vacuolar-type H+-ATPase subunit F/Vma7
VPHYDRHARGYESSGAQGESVLDDDKDAMEEAAEALREAEVEAVLPNKSAANSPQLENMSIDELRALAAELEVPNRGAITEQDQLIAAIRERM